MMHEKEQNYINGKLVSAQNHLDVLNPATGEVIAQSPDSTVDDVNEAIEAAKKAQTDWAKRPAIERAGYLREIAAKIREKKDIFAKIISREQGKIMSLAEVEVDFTAEYFDYTAEWARRIEGEIITSDRPREHVFLNWKPIGVVAGILPWNFPFLLIARKMAPALLAGNSIVIKPSEETPINAHEFAKMISETNLPAGVFNMVFGRGATVGSAMSRHQDVGLITFTGSVATGRAIMRDAAENITKVNLELGGKAPVIVMDDADIDVTVNAVVASRILNSGQVCNCAERVYVQKGIAQEFMDKVSTQMDQITYGDPLAAYSKGEAIDMGPLINEQALTKVEDMVKTAVNNGAELITGGSKSQSVQGNHYLPTVLADCHNQMDIMQKEIFGPVLPIQTISDLDEAIALANDSSMGLTSSIFTTNINSAMKASRELKFGETYINREHMEALQGFHAGVRQSGIGGADGKHGLYEFMQSQVTYLQET